MQTRRALLRLAALASLLACADSDGTEQAEHDGSSASSDTQITTESESDTDTDTDTDTTTETGTGTDELPPAPTLSSPSDGATQLPIETELCWNLVDDPEGEPLRYRVFIDDTVLTQGVLEPEAGYEGPCVGPLLFALERSYVWQVEAFELDDPTRSSPKSEAWTFSTIGDGLSETVFVDPFDEDLGWAVSGDASSGAWVRGDPREALNDGERSQPGVCAGGTSCTFTGQNPDGLADQADVSGGATILTSPAFDLSGAATASVRLQRFFYKSELLSGPALKVELLVPNDAAPDGYDAHDLELLETATTELALNAWSPREYVACGLPMAAGSRLRITATDSGAGILEAAIDSVSVHAYDDPSVCAAALGGACDPTLANPCPGELLCCSQGAVNVGVHRCEQPVAGLDFDNPPPTPADPGTGPLGCDAPDLIVDPTFIEPLFTDIFITDATCELLEGCVGSTGWRTVMLFTLATPNIGSTDMALGVPANLPDLFHYSACHDHYHFDEFARYELLDGDTVVATGHKQAFCLLDQNSWAWPFELPKFDCANQGVSRGFTDVYEAGLPCQWVDVTDTPPGNYMLRATLNQPRPAHAQPTLNERDYTNNTLEFPVVIPD
ncbi:lysyl oxidase family protein [Enhygromyxa salina]|uniref:Lysyl oxidase n=1 Tax=Enhygromyxa salina TaxID=215803 RepID=A0A2S9YNT7_9BACT|nr:lysyl oxidase family protein [Enhygromyxa salina]PRQ06729.1 Lysyl oxidase [Enhygromyxa salina]